MKKNPTLYLKLFTSTFYLSSFTFGGGYVIVPLMKKKFVDDLHWLEESEMLDLTAIAQSTPGAIAVSASLLVGYRVAGIPGALVTLLGTITPPLILISIISLFYAAFRANPWISALLKGMQAGVAAVIADVTINMGGDCLRKKEILPPIIMAAAFIATFFFNVNVIYIILPCILLGVFLAVYESKHKEGKK